MRILQLEAFISEKCGVEVPASQFNDEQYLVNNLDSRLFSNQQA